MRLRALLAATVTVLAVTVVSAAPAAATSYRYWTYWHGMGSSWAFSSYGPAARPADGAVEGWRFEVSAATSSTAPPRAAPSFATVCGATPAQPDRKRIALVVDFGTVDSRPPGQVPPRGIDTFCAVVPATANGYQVLTAYAAFTAQAGLVCSIAGYPVGECGAPVTLTSPSPTAAAPTATSRATATPAPTSRASTATPVPTTARPVATATPTAVPTPAVTTPSAPPSAVAVGPGGLPPGTGGSSGGGPPLGAAAGGLLVVGLAVAGLLKARRSR